MDDLFHILLLLGYKNAREYFRTNIVVWWVGKDVRVELMWRKFRGSATEGTGREIDAFLEMECRRSPKIATAIFLTSVSIGSRASDFLRFS